MIKVIPFRVSPLLFSSLFVFAPKITFRFCSENHFSFLTGIAFRFAGFSICYYMDRTVFFYSDQLDR